LRETGRPAGVKDRCDVVLAQIVDYEWLTIRQLLAGQKGKAGARIGNHVFNFRFTEASVDRHRDRTSQLCSEESETPIQPVSESNRYPVSSVNSILLQAAGNPSRPIPELAIVDSLAA